MLSKEWRSLLSSVIHRSLSTRQSTSLTKHNVRIPGPWFNIKMPSYQYRKSHCGDKTVVRLSYLHTGISYTGKMALLYWIRLLFFYTNLIYLFLTHAPPDDGAVISNVFIWNTPWGLTSWKFEWTLPWNKCQIIPLKASPYYYFKWGLGANRQ